MTINVSSYDFLYSYVFLTIQIMDEKLIICKSLGMSNTS